MAGSGKPNCVEGINCGRSCVASTDHCLGDLSPQGADAASKVAEIIKNVTVLSKKEISNNTNLSSPDEAKAYLDVLEGRKPRHNEPEWEAWASKPENIEKVWSSIDAKTRKVFETAGKVTGASAEGGLYMNGGKERGKAVLQAFIAAGGKDITGKALDQWNRQIELDHITPASRGGRDEPKNWQIVSSKINQLKRADSDEDFLAKLKTQANQSQADYESKIKAGKEKAEKGNEKASQFSNPVARRAITDKDLDSMKTDDLKALSKGIGITYKSVRIGKQDLATGEIKAGAGSGTLTNGQMKRLAKEALILERMREQGLTKYPHNYLPNTARDIQKEMEASNPKSKNPVKLAKPLQEALDYKDAPDISKFELIPQIAVKG